MLQQAGRSDRRSRSASQDSDREMEAIHDQIEANEAVIKEHHDQIDAIEQAAVNRGLHHDHER